MKRWLSALLCALLICALLPAADAAVKEKLTAKNTGDVTFFVGEYSSKVAFNVTYTGYDEATIKIQVKDRVDKTVYHLPSVSVYSGQKFEISTSIFTSLSHYNVPRGYTITLTTDHGYKRNFDVYQTLLKGKSRDYYLQQPNKYYKENTVCSFGPHFRDVSPSLTDLWYMFTPLDLSKQGAQTFVLVAGNLYEIGEATVNVSGDSVTVSYVYFHGGEDGSTEDLTQFITFFPDYDSITNVVPEQIGTKFAFNRAFSIADDLSGDTDVIMLIRNTVNYWLYPTYHSVHTRFWENKSEYKTVREAMLKSIGK